MIEEFKETIWSFTAPANAEGTKIVKVLPTKSVALKKDKLKDRDAVTNFLKGIQSIPNIGKGISHKAMQDIQGFELDENESLIIVAIGDALNLWDSSPMNIEQDEMRKMYIEQDTLNLLPTTVGYSVQNAMAKLNE